MSRCQIAMEKVGISNRKQKGRARLWFGEKGKHQRGRVTIGKDSGSRAEYIRKKGKVGKPMSRQSLRQARKKTLEKLLDSGFE